MLAFVEVGRAGEERRGEERRGEERRGEEKRREEKKIGRASWRERV